MVKSWGGEASNQPKEGSTMVTAEKAVFPELGKGSLTVRELVTAMALQGILSGPLSGGEKSPISPKEAARWAMEYADQLLSVLP
jgi:hypothetical protein